MDGQHIGPAEQLGPGHVRRPRPFGGFAAQVRAPRDDIHTEGRPDARHPATDPAQAQHAQHRTAELATDRRLPTAGAHRQVLVDDSPGGGQDERPGEFDRRLDVASGRAHMDAAFLSSRNVNRRIERPGGRDHLQLGETLDDLARQGRSLPHDAHHVEGRQPFDHRVRIGKVVVEDGDVSSGGDRRPVGHVQRDVLVVVEDRDLHRAQSSIRRHVVEKKPSSAISAGLEVPAAASA